MSSLLLRNSLSRLCPACLTCLRQFIARRAISKGTRPIRIKRKKALLLRETPFLTAYGVLAVFVV